METKHTPGPWQICEYADGATMVEHREPTGYGYAQTQVARIMPVCDEASANARLIAAAPDMLAAIDALLIDMRECGLIDYYDEANAIGMSGAVSLARGAIAKARGG